MRLVPTLVAVGGVVIAAAGLLAAGGSIAPQQPVASAPTQADPPSGGNSLRIDPEPSIAEVRRQPIRPVAPEIVAPPPLEDAELLRIEPRQPLSPIGRAPVPSEGPPEARPLHRPVADAAGRFEAQGYHVELAGILATEPGTHCGEGPAAWPCGIHARTAFRNLLRGRALTCVVPPAPPQGALVLDCRLGKLDPAGWLVESGWARAVAGGPYAELETKAREAGRGMYGPRPDASAPPTPDPTLPATSGVPAASGG